MDKECLVCKKVFKVKPSHFNKRMCCSRICRSIYLKTAILGKNNPNFRNSGIKKCFICGKEFKSYNKNKKMCSLKCVGLFNKTRERNNSKTILTCKICNKEFKSYNKNRITCSRVCSNIYNVPLLILRNKQRKIQHLKKEDIPLKKGDIPLLISRNKRRKVHSLKKEFIPLKEFIYPLKRKTNRLKKEKFCKDCGLPVKRKQVRCLKCREKKFLVCNPILTCKICGKGFRSYRFSGKVYCSTSCQSKARRNNMLGNNNPRYKHGLKQLTQRIRGSEKNKKIIKEILERDKFTCQYCGKVGGKLEVDHKLRFSEIFQEFLITINDIHNITNESIFKKALEFSKFWDRENLQVLCRSCNQQKENSWRIKNNFYGTHPAYNKNIKQINN